MSKTKSASSGTPYLNPNDITASRTLGPLPSAKTGWTFFASWWTLRPEVSMTTSATARRSASMLALADDAVEQPPLALEGVRRGPTRSGGPAPRRWRRGTRGWGASHAAAARRAAVCRWAKNPRARTSTTAAIRGRSACVPRRSRGRRGRRAGAGGRLSTTYQPESSSDVGRGGATGPAHAGDDHELGRVDAVPASLVTALSRPRR